MSAWQNSGGAIEPANAPASSPDQLKMKAEEPQQVIASPNPTIKEVEPEATGQELKVTGVPVQPAATVKTAPMKGKSKAKRQRGSRRP